MGFSIKAWLNPFGSGTAYDQPVDTGITPQTPVDAAGLRDLEQRASAGIDATVATHAATPHPSAAQAAALVGTNGTPSSGNPFVTNSDPRNANARAPTAHAHLVADLGTGAPAAGKYLDGAGAWAALPAASGVAFTPAGTIASTTVQAAIEEVAAEAGGAGAQPARTVTGTTANYGAALAVDFVNVARTKQYSGVVNANLVATVTNPVAGSELILDGQNDGAGGHTLTVNGTPVPLPQAPNAPIDVVVRWFDAVTFRIVSAGVETDPLAVLKSSFAGKGSMQVATAAGTPADQAVGADGRLWVPDSSQANGWAFKTLAAAGVEATANKGAANGYAGLGAGSLVPQAQLGSGSGGAGTKFLADDQTYKVPAGGGGGAPGSATPLAIGKWYLPPTGSIGGSNIAAAQGTAYAQVFTAGRAATMAGIKAQCQVAGTAGTRYRWVIVVDGDGAGDTGWPGGGVASGAVIVTNADIMIAADVTGLLTATFAVAPVLVLGTKYWLVGWQADAAATNTAWKGGNGHAGNPMQPSDPTNPSIGGSMAWAAGATLGAGAIPAGLFLKANWTVSSNFPHFEMGASA